MRSATPSLPPTSPEIALVLRQRLLRTALQLTFLSLILTIPGLIVSAEDHRQIVAPAGSDLGLPFSPAIWAGDFLLLSGALGNTPGTIDVPGDAVTQTKQTLANLETILKAADLDFSRVVSSDLYLADRSELREIATAYDAAFEGGVKPALATLEADIALRDAKVEIGMIAVRKGVEIKKITPRGWQAAPNLSWGVMAGDSLYVAGMMANDPTTGRFVPGDAGSQTTRTMENLGAVLKAAGMDFEDLVRCRVFLADARDYGAMNDAYGAFFQGVTPPARATVRARLLPADAKIQVQCQAVRSAEGDRHVRRAAGEVPSGRPFSPSIETGGRLFLAGMVGRGPQGYPAGVEAQTRVTLDRLARTLEAAGLTFKDVASATVYLTDIRHYGAMNKIYAEVLGSVPPARATVGTALMSPDALVEIQMTAIVPPK